MYWLRFGIVGMVNFICKCTLAVMEYAYSYIILLIQIHRPIPMQQVELGDIPSFFLIVEDIDTLGILKFERIADGCSSRCQDHKVTLMVSLLN